MVLPLLMSIGLPALAGTGALASVPILGTMGAAGLAGVGAGLGSFLQTGDIGKGIQTGLTSFLGGKVLGGLTGGAGMKDGTAMERIMGSQASAREAALESIKQAGGTGFIGGLPTGTEGSLFSGGLQGAAAGAMLPGVLSAGLMGQTMTDAQMMQEEYKNRAAQDGTSTIDQKPPLPNPMQVTQSADPFASGGGEGLYFQYRRPPRPVGYTPQYPYYYADGGLMGLRRMQEGGEAEVDEMMEDNGMNEKDVIVEAIEAIKGMSEQPEIALAMFVQKYGEDALRDLVGRVQSGELDDTVARFEEGEKGMVRGPGDGSGVDDMVPATLEGEQDVLLSDGEFVLRKKTTDALEKAYGGGFLDIVNRAEEDAPEKLQQMVG